MVKFSLLHNFPWILFPNQLYALFYSFCVSLLHSLITSLSRKHWVAGFHWCTLADFNNGVFWMVSILPMISHSSSPLSNPLETVSSTPTTIGITVNLMFHSFCSSQVRFKYLSLFSLSFIFTVWFAGMAKSTWEQIFFFFLFLLISTRSYLLAGIRWSVCISKSKRILYISFSRTDPGLCIYYSCPF